MTKSNSFSNGPTSRHGITGPLASKEAEAGWAEGLHDPRVRT